MSKSKGLPFDVYYIFVHLIANVGHTQVSFILRINKKMLGSSVGRPKKSQHAKLTHDRKKKKKIRQWLPLFIEGRNCLRRGRKEVSVFILWQNPAILYSNMHIFVYIVYLPKVSKYTNTFVNLVDGKILIEKKHLNRY